MVRLASQCTVLVQLLLRYGHRWLVRLVSKCVHSSVQQHKQNNVNPLRRQFDRGVSSQVKSRFTPRGYILLICHGVFLLEKDRGLWGVLASIEEECSQLITRGRSFLFRTTSYHEGVDPTGARGWTVTDADVKIPSAVAQSRQRWAFTWANIGNGAWRITQINTSSKPVDVRPALVLPPVLHLRIT